MSTRSVLPHPTAPQTWCFCAETGHRLSTGYLIEVGQATGALHGHLAKKRQEDLPG
jgi:hypothetical protein